MMRLEHKFVEFIPKELEDNTLYISIKFSTAVHKCCCGCGQKTVTPFSPTDWKLTFNGKSVSLSPSIGNWSFPCRSHYWITNNKVKWAPGWNKEKEIKGKEENKVRKTKYFNEDNNIPKVKSKKLPWWEKLLSYFNA